MTQDAANQELPQILIRMENEVKVAKSRGKPGSHEPLWDDIDSLCFVLRNTIEAKDKRVAELTGALFDRWQYHHSSCDHKGTVGDCNLYSCVLFREALTPSTEVERGPQVKSVSLHPNGDELFHVYWQSKEVLHYVGNWPDLTQAALDLEALK